MSEHHHDAILQRTPHSARQTAPCRVYIGSLPALRGGSNPTAVDEAAGEGRRYSCTSQNAVRRHVRILNFGFYKCFLKPATRK